MAEDGDNFSATHGTVLCGCTGCSRAGGVAGASIGCLVTLPLAIYILVAIGIAFGGFKISAIGIFQHRCCNGDINILICITVNILEHQFGARWRTGIQFYDCTVYAGNSRATLGSVNVSGRRINSTCNCNLGIIKWAICQFRDLCCSQLSICERCCRAISARGINQRNKFYVLLSVRRRICARITPTIRSYPCRIFRIVVRIIINVRVINIDAFTRTDLAGCTGFYNDFRAGEQCHILIQCNTSALNVNCKSIGYGQYKVF